MLHLTRPLKIKIKCFVFVFSLKHFVSLLAVCVVVLNGDTDSGLSCTGNTVIAHRCLLSSRLASPAQCRVAQLTGDLSLVWTVDLSLIWTVDLSLVWTGDLSLVWTVDLSLVWTVDLSLVWTGNLSLVLTGDLSLVWTGDLALASLDWRLSSR